jgi:hypothetical protein
MKLGALVVIKETYLFLRNVYGIYSHPFLTTKRIMEEKDLSQGVLIFGLPFYLWLGWVAILLVSRIFIFRELRFGFLARASFLLVSFSFSLLFLFLGYWLFMVYRKKAK